MTCFLVALTFFWLNAVYAAPVAQPQLGFPIGFPSLNETFPFNTTTPFPFFQNSPKSCYVVSGTFKKFNGDFFTYVDTSVFWLLQSPALSVQCIQQKVSGQASSILGCAVQVSDGASTGLFFIYQKGGYYVAVDAPALRKLDYVVTGNTHAFKHCDGATFAFTRNVVSMDLIIVANDHYDQLTNGLCGDFQGGQGYHFTPRGYEVVRVEDWAPTWSLPKDQNMLNQFFNTAAIISPAAYQSMQYVPPNVKAELAGFPAKQKQVCAATPVVIKLSNMIMLPETQNLKSLLPMTENEVARLNPGYYPGIEQLFDTSNNRT